MGGSVNPAYGNPGAFSNFNINQAPASAMQQAYQGTAQGMNYQPMQAQGFGYDAMQINAPSAVAGRDVSNTAVQAGQIANTDLSQYQNPYQTQVIDQTMSDLDRARQMTMNNTGAQAQSAGAFGGSRHGIQEAETNRAFADQMARSAGQMRQQGFQNAQQQAQFDIANRLGADQFSAGQNLQSQMANQGADLTSSSANAQNQLQTNLANQNAFNQASRFGAQAQNQANLANQQAGLAGNQQRLGASNQMGGMANMGFGMGRQMNQDMMNQGGMQQALMQQLINASKGQYGGFTGANQNSLGLPLQALGVAPAPQTQRNSMQPGLFNYLTMGAMM